jgi:hypothetical protein
MKDQANDVYRAIGAVMAKLAKIGIAKDNKNEQQGYKFRGIDDVYNALAPVLAEEGLVILPSVKSRESIERQTARGGTLFYVVVDVDFSFVSVKDGSSHIVSVCGEAMDSGDKATNKAMSAAFKYACIQAFCIPTEGDNDADKTTHVDVAPVVAAKKSKTIGKAELQTIQSLSAKAGVPPQKICDAYGIESIDQLAMDKAAEVIERLQAVAIKTNEGEVVNG